MQCTGDFDALLLEIMMHCNAGDYDAMRWRF